MDVPRPISAFALYEKWYFYIYKLNYQNLSKLFIFNKKLRILVFLFKNY